jgi:hypothetical protein
LKYADQSLKHIDQSLKYAHQSHEIKQYEITVT